MKSPVTSLSKPFKFDRDMFFKNIFIDLGLSSKGRHHFVLFTSSTLNFEEIQIIEDTKRVYSSDCIQYLIKGIENKVLGCFFEVNSRKLNFDSSHCNIVDSELEEDFAVTNDSSGGVYVFSDNEESFLLIPENPNTSRYVVLQ
jgi:hypothetical protein